MDFQTLNPAIDAAYFPNTSASSYWSGDNRLPLTSFAWTVVFDYGYLYASLKDNVQQVRLVRGGQ